MPRSYVWLMTAATVPAVTLLLFLVGALQSRARSSRADCSRASAAPAVRSRADRSALGHRSARAVRALGSLDEHADLRRHQALVDGLSLSLPFRRRRLRMWSPATLRGALRRASSRACRRGRSMPRWALRCSPRRSRRQCTRTPGGSRTTRRWLAGAGRGHAGPQSAILGLHHRRRHRLAERARASRTVGLTSTTRLATRGTCSTATGGCSPKVQGAWTIPGSAFALYHHEEHMEAVEYQNLVRVRHATPAHIGVYDGVPIIYVYAKPGQMRPLD